MRVNFSVTNQLATPAINAAALANRPAAGQPGRVFIDTDNPSTGMYRDTGTSWVQIAAGTGLLNLQTVTDFGNTTTNEVTIGSATAPTASLDVYGGGDSPDIVAKIQGTSTNSAFIQFTQNGAARFFTGNRYKGGANLFIIGNSITPQDTFLINHSTNNIAIGGHTDTPAYLLSIGGTLQNTTSAFLSTDSGNVGIGTTSASYKLDVNGTTRIQGTELRLDNATTGTINIYSATPRVNFFSGGGYSIGRTSTSVELTSGGSIAFYIGANQGYGLDATNGHILRSAIAGGAALARLTTGGNFMVGTTTDSGNKFRLNGSLRIDGQTSGSAGGSSGLHLIVNCDGTNYKIALNNV